ncbi:MAG: hypothetical protein ACJ766_01920 [Thermoleophilaceae bacterium]
MDHPLDGCDLRLDRAYEHLSTLDDERSAFLDQEDRRVVGHFERDPSEYVFQFAGKLPDPEIGIVLSEFAHHLRAALDNLLWQLVLLRGGSPTRATQFPIYESREGYERNARRMLRGVSADDRALIKIMQPYEATPDAPHLHALARIGWLNNTDKHRFLHVSCVAQQPSEVPLELVEGHTEAISRTGTLVLDDSEMDALSDFFAWWPIPVRDIGEVGGVRFGANSPSDDPTEFLRVSVVATGANPEMKMKDDQSVDIALSDGETSITFDELSILYRCVESVLDWFRPRFPL